MLLSHGINDKPMHYPSVDANKKFTMALAALQTAIEKTGQKVKHWQNFFFGKKRKASE
jgi:hypothetical protein